MCNKNVCLALVGLGILFLSYTIKASEKASLKYNANLIQEELINIDTKTVDSWLEVELSGEIVLPWFNGSFQPVTIEEIDKSGKYNTLSGRIKAKFFGSAILTISEDVLTGVIIKDDESYRIVFSTTSIDSDILF